MSRHLQPANRQRGLSLVESMITLGIAAVTLTTTLPGLQELRDRRRLDATVAQLATDLRHARSLAVARGQPVRLTLRADCYLVHTGPAPSCDCATSAEASPCADAARVLQAVPLDTAGGVRVQANVSSMLFDGERGTVTPAGTWRVQLERDGAAPAVRLVVNVMGRVRACSPDGTLAGYPSC
jgi:type IV fimbrial biogenesis protein FimT